MFLQLLQLVFVTELFDRQDKYFFDTVMNFLRKALENMRRFDTKTLEGCLTLMLYMEAIRVWQNRATDSLWPSECELSDFIRLCRRKRPYKSLAEAVLALACRVCSNSMIPTLRTIQENDSSNNMSTVG